MWSCSLTLRNIEFGIIERVLKSCSRLPAEKILANLFYEASTTLIPNSEKNSTRKKKNKKQAINSDDFPGDSHNKKYICNAGDLGSIPGLGRSPGEGNGYPPQYSSLENSTDRGAWQATVHWVAKCQGHDWATFTLYVKNILNKAPVHWIQ